jgi:hypothetical protein
MFYLLTQLSRLGQEFLSNANGPICRPNNGFVNNILWKTKVEKKNRRYTSCCPGSAMTNRKEADHGEIRPSVASWGEIDADNRLHIPTDVLSYLTWYETKKPCPVLIELREPGCLRLHHGGRAKELVEQRQTLLDEFDDQIEAQRRIALSHAIFIPASIGEKNRRITLRTSVLDHLRVSKLVRVLCLGYANHVEILSEESAATLAVATRIDINLDSESGD